MKLVHSAASAALIATATLLASATASADNRPALYPNAQRYHVRSPTAATGRAGNASLAVRALLGSDDKTTVELTTGTFDSPAAAPGNIKKVQLKGHDGDGEVAWTRNFTGLQQGGTVALTLAELHRGQPVQTQANINGIDGHRTDVVTVTGNVKLRPDLSVSKIDAQSVGAVGLPMNISASISELNGDTGATADCVLLVDGVAVDRANGIYVDGSSAVTCAFSYTFESGGTHTLEVRAANVAPGDYDTANNAATASIDIAGGGSFYWVAQAYNSRHSSWWYGGNWYSTANGTYASGESWEYETGSSTIYESCYLGTYSPTRVAFPLSHVTAQMTADGAVISSFEVEDAPADWDDGYQSGLYRYDPATHSHLYVAAVDSDSGSTWTSFARYGGEVTYFSRGYSTTWHSDESGVHSYTYNYDFNPLPQESYNDGSWPMTTTFTANLQVVDANGEVFQANADVPLQVTYQQDIHEQYRCYDYSWTGYSERNCREADQQWFQAEGTAYGID